LCGFCEQVEGRGERTVLDCALAVVAEDFVVLLHVDLEVVFEEIFFYLAAELTDIWVLLFFEESDCVLEVED